MRATAPLLAGLVVLTACHLGPRAVVVVSEGPVVTRCLDGFRDTSKPDERICPRRSDRLAPDEVSALRGSLDAFAARDASPMRLALEFDADNRKPHPLLLAAAVPALGPAAATAEAGRPLTDEERLAARRSLLPAIARTPVIEIDEVLAALRGSMD